MRRGCEATRGATDQFRLSPEMLVLIDLLRGPQQFEVRSAARPARWKRVPATAGDFVRGGMRAIVSDAIHAGFGNCVAGLIFVGHWKCSAQEEMLRWD